MRRVEQKIGAMKQGGAMLRNKTEMVSHPYGLSRVVAGGEIYKNVADVLDKVSDKILQRQKLEEETNRLEADKLLSVYRNNLMNAKSPEEFDGVMGAINQNMEAHFNATESGKQFWAKYGNELLENNQKDVENIRVRKEDDFGRNKLNLMLADNQNLLAGSDVNKGKILLKRGVDEIDNTNFLSKEEKEKYRNGYLTTGIYNLALNDKDGAISEAKKYFGNVGEDFIDNINKIGELKKCEKEDNLLKEKRNSFFLDWNRAMNLWSEKENGNIGGAEYFALTRDFDSDLVVDDEANSNSFKTGIVDVYKSVRKINDGNELDEGEIKNVGNSLIKAYRNKKIGLEEVKSIQNKIAQAQSDKNVLNRLFDKDLDDFVDNVLVGDANGDEMISNSFMEEKAKLGIEIYDAYYGKKLANYQSFINQGGVLTPQAERVLKKRALDEVKEEFQYKENKDGVVLFSQLKPMLSKYYSGNDMGEIWRKFYKIAPFYDDKKEALKKIAIEQQKLELSYPVFNSIKEVMNSGLDVGDKFYFKGRLAVKNA